MLGRQVLGAVRQMSTSAAAGPVEQAVVRKLTDALSPQRLTVENDSAKHAGHAAMKAIGGGGGETHFNVEVVSEAFEGKRRVERHRMVYAALGSELKEGLHALSLKLNTPSELA